MLSNYPDGMDWGAYDDYHDPKLTCGHNSSDGCDCWCEHNLHENNTLLMISNETNCALLCKDCGIELSAMRSQRKPLTNTKYM